MPSTLDPGFLAAWDERSDVASAKNAANLTAKELKGLRAGILVKWRRTRAVKAGRYQHEVTLYLDFGAAGAAAVALPPPQPGNTYVTHHDCLLAGDCVSLSYICDETYCDEVSILAKATQKKVSPPTHPENTWQGTKKPIPLFEGVAVADRFGIFPSGRTH